MKFIYATSKEGKEKLQLLGYKYIKKQKNKDNSNTTLYVFENNPAIIEQNFSIDDIGCIYSDILMF